VGVRRCEFCTTPAVYVQWLSCRDGRRRLFEATPVDVDQVPPGKRGWVPGRATVRGRNRVVMAPIDQVSYGKAEAARRVMVEHRCPRLRELYDQALGTSG
jgi:hypothetical protein